MTRKNKNLILTQETLRQLTQTQLSPLKVGPETDFPICPIFPPRPPSGVGH